MSRLSPDWLSLVHVALPTAFTADGETVVLEPLAKLVNSLWDSGHRVFLPAAGNGEFHSLSQSEVISCVETTRAALGGDGIVVGALGFDLHKSIVLGKDLVSAGADALLYMPPTHPYLCDEGFGPLIRKLTAKLSVPLMVYKRGPVPSNDLLVDLIVENTIVGVKYAVNDMASVYSIVKKLKGRSGIMCGTGESYAPFYSLAGAIGFSSGAANIAPRISLALHKSLKLGDYGSAMDALEFLKPFEDFRARSGDSYNISALKAAMKSRGLDFGPARLPQRRLTPSEEQELTSLTKALSIAEDSYSKSRVVTVN